MNRKGSRTTEESIPTPAPVADEEQNTTKDAASRFPVVGVGASAGGLAAFESFFSGMPADVDPGMAFVLVQHLSPDHKSILSDLVKRYTRMQVFEVEDGMVVKPNCTYIIPPNRDMALSNGKLRLLEQSAPRGMRLPIDFFFRSLAEDQHERAICIVLSGTGGDGTIGLRAIKGEGGMAMAQDPDSTEYDGMPRSAIASGLVDYVLPPALMPAQLMAYTAHAFDRTVGLAATGTDETEDLLKIFVQLKAKTGHDFADYKQSTISRRVERRMAVHQMGQLPEYVRYLQGSPEEADALFHDLLIGVTSFFRDSESFASLQEHVIPYLIADKSADATIRVWVPGCSTGEEAYSIAILLQEQMEALKQPFQVQVFATDIDRRAIEQARSGVYPGSISADVSAERLSRFFVETPDGSGYRVQKALRDLLIFSEQDVTRDPPYSNLDLISCRNVLIYMGSQLQKKLLPLFHYALNTNGFLFLGTSETVGEFSALFSTLDSKAKLYQARQSAPGMNPVPFGQFVTTRARQAEGLPATGMTPPTKSLPLRELTEMSLLRQYAPVAALVDDHGQILYLHGRTGRYLELSPGEAGMHILKMAREGLQRELTGALRQAVSSHEPVHRRGLRVKTNGDYTTVDLTVRPATNGPERSAVSALFLVIFEEAAETDKVKHSETDSDSAGGPHPAKTDAAHRRSAGRTQGKGRVPPVSQ